MPGELFGERRDAGAHAGRAVDVRLDVDRDRLSRRQRPVRLQLRQPDLDGGRLIGRKLDRQGDLRAGREGCRANRHRLAGSFEREEQGEGAAGCLGRWIGDDHRAIPGPHRCAAQRMLADRAAVQESDHHADDHHRADQHHEGCVRCAGAQDEVSLRWGHACHAALPMQVAYLAVAGYSVNWGEERPLVECWPHALGCGQAVRRLTLDQEIEGSNPSAPANTARRYPIDRAIRHRKPMWGFILPLPSGSPSHEQHPWVPHTLTVARCNRSPSPAARVW